MKRKYVLDVQPARKKPACCQQCRAPFTAGEVRCCPRAKAGQGGGSFLHLDCIHGGLQPVDEIVKWSSEVTNEHLRDVRARGGQLQPESENSVDEPMGPASVDAPPAPQAASVSNKRPTQSAFEENILRNMDWWDKADIERPS